MVLATLLAPKVGPSFDEPAGAGFLPIQVQVGVSDVHEFTDEISGHPLEDGSTIEDHIALGSNMVTVEGVFSEARADLISNVERIASGPTAGEDYEAVLSLRERKVPFVLVTGLRIYENCVFESFAVRRDRTTGQAIGFSARVRQLRFANTETVTEIVNTTSTAAQSTAEVGTKSAAAAPPAAEAAAGSTLSRVVTTDVAAATRSTVQSFGEFISEIF